MNGSPRGTLGALDVRKLAWSLGFSALASLLVWITSTLIPALQESGDSWALAAAAFLPFFVNLARKWLSDTRQPQLDEPQAPAMMGVARGDIFRQISDAEHAGVISAAKADRFRERANSGSLLALFALAIELIKLLREWRQAQ